MAPITDDTVEALRDTIHKLESRVQQLEAKLEHSNESAPAGSSKKPFHSVRMILMGPPGAGACPRPQISARAGAYVWYRQGNTGTEDPGKILCLPFGTRSQACRARSPATEAYNLS